MTEDSSDGEGGASARHRGRPSDASGGDDGRDLKDHQTHLEGRGIYDERNRVNDLTGREWKFATKSVIPESYPPDLQHDLRSEHGGQKPPRLCAELIGRFSKAGERVLDPFAGVGGTLLGASLCEHEGTGLREAVGFERNRRWVECYETVLERENEERLERGAPPLASQDLRHGDCVELVADLETDSVDLLLTDVPYWNMDEREQTRNRKEVRESSLGAFDEDERESQSKAEWLAEMGETFAQLVRVVEPGRYVVVFIGDMYREQRYEFLSADLARAIEAAAPVTLKATLVWYDPAKNLHVYGYPYAFVPSMVHQNVLVFQVDD
ncbi:site-specific DNA-methyltransferase [Natronobiforma cellulositropha]|uniref:site-specific DNA-methyltransferase n=1 Tax=Natronobiforma cellulositropha TaxID=1679076 RepID=UPI0021D5C25D|nr:site-specific DNA-methyltransferase [Natronobiforma cellulositropha]